MAISNYYSERHGFFYLDFYEDGIITIVFEVDFNESELNEIFNKKFGLTQNDYSLSIGNKNLNDRTSGMCVALSEKLSLKDILDTFEELAHFN